MSKIQEVINNGISSEKLLLATDHVSVSTTPTDSSDFKPITYETKPDQFSYLQLLK
ncbi:1185_t:CDS:2 [Funneliformis mosseae]|uniref:1185_t:CDS:1 n=1 Tax=Funneliformis mosseae TaxID=27381 RepID=A0A9N9B626_FUNMO|nr:1185_t:CDS:2 [Funneliformis mosseae]